MIRVLDISMIIPQTIKVLEQNNLQILEDNVFFKKHIWIIKPRKLGYSNLVYC